MTPARRGGDDQPARHAAQLADAGYTVIERLLDADAIAAAKAALDELHAATEFGSSDFTGFRTKRVFNLLAKTRALDPLLTDRTVLELVRHALGPEAQLSIASTMEIWPGETVQPLHQDDAYFPATPHPPLVVNTMWALTDFSAANGATRLVPGSHRVAGPVDTAAEWTTAAMPAGSVLLWNGATWHGGGANKTDAVRFGVSLNYCRGWIRQQENQYLAVPRAVAASLSSDVQALLGYDVCQFLGYADGRHPRRMLFESVA